MKKAIAFVFIYFFAAGLVLVSTPVFAQDKTNFVGDQANKGPQLAGEFFGVPVPMGNYYFVKGAIVIFGNQWGPSPTTPKELEDCIWNDLLLSYEAFQKNIQVSQEEVDKEITKTLKAENVKFDWKKDKDAYGKWIKERTHEPAEVFGNQIKHLIQLRKLRQQVMDGITPAVSDQEAYQKFLDEYNTLEIELVQFDEKKEAEEFYKKVQKDPKFWETEKSKGLKKFQHPGFVALEFLMNMWQLPREAVYKMMGMKIGAIYPPAPIYKGYGIFKVLKQRPVDEFLPQYPKLKANYHAMITMQKKYDGFNAWVKDLKQRANIKVYPVNS